MAVFAPMPKVRVRMAMTVKSGACTRRSRAWRKLVWNMRTSGLRGGYAPPRRAVHKSCDSRELFAFEDVDRVLVCQRVGDRPVVRAVLGGLEGDAMDHQDLAGQVELEMDGFPVILTDIFLNHQDGAAFVEAADDSPAEVHISDEV